MSSLGGLIVLAVLTAASLAAMGYLMIAMITHNQIFMEKDKDNGKSRRKMQRISRDRIHGKTSGQ